MTPTREPYVGLDFFHERDADRFFGRDAERQRIIGNLRGARLTLLHAESGVGKSSLLRAGVAARIRRSALRSDATRFAPVVYSDWHTDPIAGLTAALEEAAQPLLTDGGPLRLPRDALEDAIAHVAEATGATSLFILDQFEERFLYERADEFDVQLADCVNRRHVRARFLISVREDAYSQVGDRFKALIPNVYGNYLGLDFLAERAAAEAISGPVAAYNAELEDGSPSVEIEPELVESVLEQVRRGRVVIGEGAAPASPLRGRARVETAYLQLVMKRIWDEEVAAGSAQLRLETLRRLGGAETIVHAHLDDVMSKLSPDERDAAAAAFRFLVTSNRRKIALSTQELSEFSDASAPALESALQHLEHERILRPVASLDPDGGGHREIYHDVLAPAILDWRQRHVEAQRRAESERRLAAARQRARRLEVRNRRLTAAVVALATVAAALTLYLLNPGALRRFELQTVDARLAVRAAHADPRLVIVSVDDRTLAGRAKLPRGDYARMLPLLARDAPAVIAVDVAFTERGEDPAADRALLAAIRSTSRRLVLAFSRFDVAVSGSGDEFGRPILLGRPDGVRATGLRTGFAGLPQDDDDLHRRADQEVAISGANATVRTFAFAAAEVATGRNLERRLPAAAARRAWGEQSTKTAWIDFAGAPGSVRRVSAVDVLNGRVPAGTFADKLVVIGVVTRDSKDVHPTPVDDADAMSGPEIQANALSTMVRGEPLRDVPMLVDLLVVVALACVPAAAFLLRSPLHAALGVIGTLALFLAVALAAFAAGWIVAVTVPLAALAFGTAGVLGTRRRPKDVRTLTDPPHGRFTRR